MPSLASSVPLLNHQQRQSQNVENTLRRIAAVASVLQEPSSNLHRSSFPSLFSLLCEAALHAPVELLQQFVVIAKEQSTVIPIISMTFLSIISGTQLYVEDVRHKALQTLNTFLKRLPSDLVESVFPGLSTRLCAVCFTNFNLEFEAHMLNAVDCLFDTWFLFYRKHQDKLINLIEIIYGKYEGTVKEWSPRLQDRLLHHLQRLCVDDHELGIKLLLMFAADGFDIKFGKTVPIIDLTLKYLDRQTTEAQRVVLGAVRALWPNDAVPEEFCERILDVSLGIDNRKLVTYKNQPVSSLLDHMARNDNSLSMRILSRFVEADNTVDILNALSALRSTVKYAQNPAEVIDTLMQQHDWLVGERDTALAPWDDMIPMSVCLVLRELCTDGQKMESFVPYFLPFLLAGIASEHDKRLQGTCEQTMNVLLESLSIKNIDTLLTKHMEHLLQILSVQLACPFAHPLCPRVIGLLSRRGADEASIGSITRRILSLLQDAQQLPAYAHILITSLNDCVTAITRQDLLLLLWDTVIPYTWSDDPSTRSVSLSVVAATMLKFAPNDEQILNKLHLSWPSLLAVLRQCPDYQDTLQFTLLMLSRAPDFLSQRYVKEWWPLLKSKPRSASLYLAIRDAFKAGLRVHTDAIADFFKFVERGLEDGTSGAMEAFIEMESIWSDYGWFIRHHTLTKYFGSK